MQRLQQILCFNKNGVLVILRTVTSALDSVFTLTLLLTLWDDYICLPALRRLAEDMRRNRNRIDYSRCC